MTTPDPPAPPTGIVFHGASQASNRVTTTLTLARPSGAKSGDVVIASVDVRGTPTITPPAGWTAVREKNAAFTPGTDLTKTTLWHIIGPNEPSSYAWSFSAASAASGVLAAYAGVDLEAPVEAYTQLNQSGTAVSRPSVTASAGSMLVGFFGIATNATYTPPSGMTERCDVAVTPGSLKVASEAVVQPGADPPRRGGSSVAVSPDSFPACSPGSGRPTRGLDGSGDRPARPDPIGLGLSALGCRPGVRMRY